MHNLKLYDNEFKALQEIAKAPAGNIPEAALTVLRKIVEAEESYQEFLLRRKENRK